MKAITVQQPALFDQPRTILRAISLIQPRASLIILGFKQIETRSWNTKHTGDLVIHASTTMPCRLGERLTLGEFEVERDRAGLLLRGPIAWPYRLPMGAVIGRADLTHTESTNSLECAPDDRNRALGDFSADRYAWYLNGAQACHPIPCKGSLSLWTVPDDIAARLA